MSSTTTTRLAVEHVCVTVRVGFDAFTRNLESLAGSFDPTVLTTASPESLQPMISGMEGEEGLMIFGKLDHGVLFSMQGEHVEALRYHIGNPLIAFSMTRHNIGAALYAPLTVLVRAVDANTTEVQFDRPSTLFGQFGDAAVTKVGHDLDGKLDRLIEKAAVRIDG